MKIGIIGLGRMGMHHADDVRKFEFVREVVGCDVSDEARKRAEATGMRTCPDVTALLEEKPDAAIVVTHPATHAGLTRQCFEAGVPVLTEKPLSVDVREGRELVALAEKKKLHFQVGFEMRYNGSTAGMKDIVDNGIIGRPRYMSLVQISGHLVWGLTRALHGGIFYEKLCHEIDLFRWFFGEPERVMAVSGPRVIEHYDIPDNVLSCLAFPGGEQGNITFLTTRAAQVGGTSDHGDRGHFFELILTCTGGSVTYDAWTERLEVVRFNHRPDRQSELVESIDIASRYGTPSYNVAAQDRDFLERMRDGRPLRFPASDAQVSMEWVERAERSLELGGKWIGKDQ